MEPGFLYGFCESKLRSSRSCSRNFTRGAVSSGSKFTILTNTHCRGYRLFSLLSQKISSCSNPEPSSTTVIFFHCRFLWPLELRECRSTRVLSLTLALFTEPSVYLCFMQATSVKMPQSSHFSRGDCEMNPFSDYYK